MKNKRDKTYGQMIIEARQKTDRQEVGETVSELAKYFKNLIEEICNLQAEKCLEKGFTIDKYYIWIGLRKDDLTANALHIIPVVRKTRPIPDHTIFKDHMLWSVHDMNRVVFEWNVMSPELTEYIVHNKPKFETQTVQQAIKQKTNKIDKIEDYMENGILI